jgi:signal transduction histidine kinase
MVELRPPALDEWGLSAALSDYAKSFEEQTGIACTVHAGLGLASMRQQLEMAGGSCRSTPAPATAPPSPPPCPSR